MIGTEFLVSGWGMTVDGVSSSRSPILKAAFVYGIANIECEETFAHVVSLFLDRLSLLTSGSYSWNCVWIVNKLLCYLSVRSWVRILAWSSPLQQGGPQFWLIYSSNLNKTLKRVCFCQDLILNLTLFTLWRKAKLLLQNWIYYCFKQMSILHQMRFIRWRRGIILKIEFSNCSWKGSSINDVTHFWTIYDTSSPYCHVL